MYSPILQAYTQQIAEAASVDVASVSLLEKSLACLVGALGQALGATTHPAGDLLDMSVRLLLLSDALSRLPPEMSSDGAHYLVALGFEQSGGLLTRLRADRPSDLPPPLDNDHWYGLLLALLHYLAGGYRVQALGVLRQLEDEVSTNTRVAASLMRQYEHAMVALRLLKAARRTGAVPQRGSNSWYDLLFGLVAPGSHQELHLQRLAQMVRRRRDVVLSSLGEGDEAAWLFSRGGDRAAADFWAGYLNSLDRRGITAFTREQIGEEGDFAWLGEDRDLLVILPTGSGKTIIGELRSALALAHERQALWMLPTRALVRQVTRQLSEAFRDMGVTVQELPTTEDFIPLFAEDLGQSRHISVTTPERLASLLRSNPTAVAGIGVVVFDEAQILLTESRGTTSEFVLQQIRGIVPSCDFVLMSAFAEMHESLEAFLLRLGRQPELLVSDTRPTRRVYGVLTNDYSRAKQYPAALLFPPGLQTEVGYTREPLKLVLNGSRPLRSAPSALDLAVGFARASAKAGLRTAIFVSGPASAEVQSENIVERRSRRVQLPTADLARLGVELGRQSVIERTGAARIGCHHAGLTPVEQTIVERWLSRGIITTVTATPTLAQGVNLPFDVSIVTYTTRRTRDGPIEEVPQSEILNMIGRAGRAGYVSDGFGLICYTRKPRHAPEEVLDESRPVFFRPRRSRGEHLGFSRLVERALEVGAGEPDWPIELGGLELPESEALVAFALAADERASATGEDLEDQLRSFPSMQALSEERIQEATHILESLLANIDHRVSDVGLLDVLRRTGMPIELLTHYFSRLRSISAIPAGREEQMLWVDEVVRTALESCSSREWYARFLRDHHLENVGIDRVFSLVPLWRSGYPIAGLEAAWLCDGVADRENRIGLGRFLNHGLSLFAQFWGALAVCYEAVSGSYSNPFGLLLQQSAAFVREGVSSLEQMEWLRALGGLDRVLAHELAGLGTRPMGRRAVRAQVRAWKEGQSTPPELDALSSRALEGVLGLVQR